MMTAREVFARFTDYVLGEPIDELWAPDVVIETPFAAPGQPTRIEGHEFLARSQPSRESLPVRFEEVRDVVVHDTTDPDEIIVEYTIAGTVTTTGLRASAPFISVLRVRDGKIVLWREYQHTLAIAEALGQLPELEKRYS
jgi:uncharacterized protein